MKRGFDLFLTLFSSVFWLPALLILALLVRFKVGSPVIFRQERPGLRGIPFRLIKFRTMTDCRGTDGNILPDAERLTTFGKWLRASSLDELPELLNVLKGEMSLVGPRPLLIQYLPLYTRRQALRHEAKPGITGWAQINGRNTISWEEKLELDVWYIENQSLWLDLKIIVLTIAKVFKCQDINAPGSTTAPLFTGSTQK
jgi:sugar transferase EpsL